MQKFLVISLDRKGPSPRIALDPAYSPNSDGALLKISEIRRDSDIILALTADQLRQYADRLDRMTPEEIGARQVYCFREEMHAKKHSHT